MDGASAASADTATEFGSGQTDDVANGPQKRHLRIGVDGVLDAIHLDLRRGISLKVLLWDPAHFFSVLR
jgi:hypothetical protein